MSVKIWLPEMMDEEGIHYLKERGYELEIGTECPKDCSAIISRNTRITAELMKSLPNLKVVARHGVGLDLFDLEAAKKLGIWVTYAPESNTVSVAEQVIGAMISIARSLGPCHQMIRDGNYGQRKNICGIELEGKTLGVIGFGRIGRCVAKKAALGLGMNISVYDPYVPDSLEYTKEDSLEQLLAQSDVVTLHVPLTDESRYMIGEEQLCHMKKSAILINYARGALVDPKALLKALKEGWIGGAALDVYEKEPVTADDELCSLDQVLLTPHTSSFTKKSLENMAVHSAMTVHQVLSGEMPKWYAVKGEPKSLLN